MRLRKCHSGQTFYSIGNGLSRQISYARDDNYRTRDHVLDNNIAIASLDLSYTYAVDKQITAETIAGSFLDDSSFTASYDAGNRISTCLLYTSPSPRDQRGSRMPSSA